MKVKTSTISILMVISLWANAQTQLKIAENFHSNLSDSLTHQIFNSFDKLLISIDNAQLDTTLIDSEDADLNRNFFTYLIRVEDKDTIQNYFHAQLINLYPIENNQYMLTVSYTKGNEIGRILTFHAKRNNGNIVFANPLKYNTKHWKKTTIGTITYFYQDTIDTKRAEVFNRKNIMMAQKLNLPLRDWDIYMCQNYQEALQIQGCYYEYTGNGVVNSGDIIDPKTLFSCMNDEDFSHDVLHIYASQVREKERNSTAECGLAYYWTNSGWAKVDYQTGVVDKSPDFKDLVTALQQYIQSHSDVKLLDLFDKSPNVLAEYGYAWPIHVNRVIIGVICKEIEKQKGVEGIIELLKCGRGNDNFFKSIDNLIGINRKNFDKEVYKLVFGY